jgi:hypothetical protein
MFNPLYKMKQVYERCEECFEDINMMDIIVKETPDGVCIYCPKCVEHHKSLAQKEKRLCWMWGCDINKYCKKVERQGKTTQKRKQSRLLFIFDIIFLILLLFKSVFDIFCDDT